MKIHYTITIKNKVIIKDHWSIPLLGGLLRIVEKDGYAIALKLTLEKQPLEYAPQYQSISKDRLSGRITHQDFSLPFVKYHLNTAITFLKGIYDIELLTEEISAEYEGEIDKEESQIFIKNFSTKKESAPLTIDFSLLSQAIIATNNFNASAPSFESTLTASARKAFTDQEFINSFRYSFLLIESLYGNGQFKTVSLKFTLKQNLEFQEILKNTLNNLPLGSNNTSDTDILLSQGPSTDEIIDHIIEKRGFYFHGNIKRQDAWHPDKQNNAKTLALITLSIAIDITTRAAEPIFKEDVAKLYFEHAKKMEALIMCEIKFTFKNPGDYFNSTQHLEICTPGTRVTSKNALDITQQFLNFFQENYPVSDLYEANGTIKETNKKVFSLTLYPDK